MSVQLLGIAILTAMPQALKAQSSSNSKPYLKLADSLDRPVDGYCVDIAGTGHWVDLTVPLAAHNCKGPSVYSDQAVRFETKSGRIRFPAYNVCLTALGRAGRSLVQMPLIVRPCAEDVDTSKTPFISAELQTFVFREDRRVELKNSGLCLTVGADSDSTFSASDRWRALFLETCERAQDRLSKWLLPAS